MHIDYDSTNIDKFYSILSNGILIFSNHNKAKAEDPTDVIKGSFADQEIWKASGDVSSFPLTINNNNYIYGKDADDIVRNAKKYNRGFNIDALYKLDEININLPDNPYYFIAKLDFYNKHIVDIIVKLNNNITSLPNIVDCIASYYVISNCVILCVDICLCLSMMVIEYNYINKVIMQLSNIYKKLAKNYPNHPVNYSHEYIADYLSKLTILNDNIAEKINTLYTQITTLIGYLNNTIDFINFISIKKYIESFIASNDSFQLDKFWNSPLEHLNKFPSDLKHFTQSILLHNTINDINIVYILLTELLVKLFQKT